VFIPEEFIICYYHERVYNTKHIELVYCLNNSGMDF